MNARRAALLAAAGANILWAGSYVAGKTALDVIPFVTLNAVRFGIAALIVAPLVWVRREALPRDRGGVLRLISIALFGFVANKGFEFWGLSMTTATDAALLITAESLLTLALAVAFLNDSLRPATAAAVAIGCAGVYILVEGGLVLPHTPTGAQGRGDALIVFSLALESVATISGAALLARSAAAFTLTGAAIVLSAFVWLPAAAATTGLTDAGVARLDWAGWLAILYLVLGATLAAYGMWFWALKHVSAQDVTPFLLIQPAAGALFAAVFRHERPELATVLGGGMILVGVGVVAFRSGAGEGPTVSAQRPAAP